MGLKKKFAQIGLLGLKQTSNWKILALYQLPVQLGLC